MQQIIVFGVHCYEKKLAVKIAILHKILNQGSKETYCKKMEDTYMEQAALIQVYKDTSKCQ